MSQIKSIAIYFRQDARLNYSIATEPEHIINKCKSYVKDKGYKIFGVFIDNDKEDSDSLQDLKNLIMTQDSNDRIIDGILVYNFSMLCKSIEHMQELFLNLKKQKLTVLSIEQDLSLTTQANEVLVDIIYSLFNEFKTSSQFNISEPFTERKSGTLPFGYNSNTNNGSICIDNYESALVKEAFLKTLNGWSAYKIAKHFNDQGYQTKKGSIFRTRGILDILQNEVYVTGIEQCPGIIDEKTFERVQVLINPDNLKSRKKENPHLFTDILHCPECNGPMVGNVQTRKLKDGTVIKENYYKCNNWVKNKSCNPNSLKEESIISMVYDYFNRGFQHYFSLFNNLRMNNRQIDTSGGIQSTKDVLKWLQKKYSDIEKQNDILAKHLEIQSEDVNRENFLKIIQANNKELSSLNEDILACQKEIIEGEKELESYKEVINATKDMNDPKAYFESLPDEQKKDLLSKIIKYIVIDKPSFKEYKIIDAEYNFDNTISEIGNIMGISQEEIKKQINSDNLRLYEGNINTMLDTFMYLIISRLYLLDMKTQLKDVIEKIDWRISNDIVNFLFENKIQPFNKDYKEKIEEFSVLLYEPLKSLNLDTIHLIKNFTQYIISTGKAKAEHDSISIDPKDIWTTFKSYISK